MMKRTFSTLSCMELTIEQIAELARRNGMDCVEIRLDKDHNITGYSIEQADKVLQAMAKHGVSILDLGLSASFTKEDPEQLALAMRGVDLAAAVQARAVRIFAGGHRVKLSAKADEDFDGIVRSLRALCAYAAERGVEVWAETHSNYSTGAAIRTLIDAVGHPSLYALWDVIHSIEFGEAIPDTVRILGDRIAHIHLKDGVKTADADSLQYHHTDLGIGELPLAEALAALQAGGYEGALSLEWEAPWRPELQGLHTDPDELLAVYNAWLDRAQ